MDSRSIPYLSIWRWHFYAGLVVAPFVLMLSVTGAIYLFRPYFEPWHYRSLYNVPQTGQAPGASLSADRLIPIAEGLFPGRKATAFLPAPRAGRSAVVQLSAPHVHGSGGWTGTSFTPKTGGDQEPIDVYLDPASGKALGHLAPQRMFMNRIFHLHGDLLLGNRGSMVVELAACWALVLLVTGQFLWWPKQARFSPWGILLPRLRAGGRVFWRDLHSVTGVYVLLFLAGFLVSGLPWTYFWGGLFAKAQARIGQAPPEGRFSNPFKSEPVSGQAFLPVDSVAARVEALGIPPGYSIELPQGADGTYLVRSRMASLEGASNPAHGRYLALDPYRGAVLKDIGWSQYPFLAKAVDIGVRTHQGEYFGWPNLLLGMVTASGALVISASGVWMWWKRRPAGGLGAPRPPEGYRWPKAVIALLVAAGLAFPLFGLSLILVWAAEAWIRRRHARA